jgi:hypothetical protein
MKILTVKYADEGLLKPKQYRINQLLWCMDEEDRKYSAIWGLGRLVTLVGDETREKWERHCSKLCEAVEKERLKEIEELTVGYYKGYEVMDAEARRLGHEPLPRDYFEAAFSDGRKLIICKDSETARSAEEGAVVWSLSEIVRVLESKDLVNQVKDKLGGEVKAIVPAIDWEQGDEIPF